MTVSTSENVIPQMIIPEKENTGSRYRNPLVVIALLLIFLSLFTAQAAFAEDAVLRIKEAKWESGDAILVVKGSGVNGQVVYVSNAATLASIGSDVVYDDKWRVTQRQPASVPCRVRAESNGRVVEKNVDNAPADCDQGGGGPGPNPTAGGFAVLAANDLGMHCADLDYQIFSILPPFNVVHAQVIQKGGAGNLPRLLGDDAVEVTYQATFNPDDPAVTNDPLGPLGIGGPSINTTSQNLNGVFKTNFWADSGVALPAGVNTGNYTFGGLAYAPLYPGVQVIGLLGGEDLTALCGDAISLTECPSALVLFEPLPVDLGIPVPDPFALFPEFAGTPPLLVTGQQKMPGIANTPHAFDRYDRDLPFFVNFDFGFRGRDLNWFAADGIPIMPIDDVGRSNAYPMMTVAAHNLAGIELASLDVVLPVASEADCQNCHVEPIDCLDPGLPANVQSDQCLGAGVSQTAFNVITLDDNPPGETRLEQLLNTAKINILRLHDVKHGTSYQNWDANKNLAAVTCDLSVNANDPNCISNQTPVQCSQCHYSPALDLAQAGPVNEAEQGLKGRQQVSHISMSRAMHGHHGALPDFDAEDGTGPQPLFPAMPGPVGRDMMTAQGVLEQTCYQCHPGKRTQCLRGAMAAGGVVCQDCHGDMEQVGNDFTIKVASDNPGDFVLDGSLRVPWAFEPGCQSCHTGDALDKNHPADAIVADDGIRLLQAYKTEQIAVAGVPDLVKVATILKSPGTRFAENQALNDKGQTVDVLYRLSKGHGGVMCEGCHNSTHAIWPVPNPFANDNVTSNQLQGHSGTLIECTTCHDASDFARGGPLVSTLDGPHGMHAVGNTEFAEDAHERLAKQNPDACRACHGVNGEGTVLSRMAVTRVLACKEDSASVCSGGSTATFNKGHEVTCHDCHENKL